MPVGDTREPNSPPSSSWGDWHRGYMQILNQLCAIPALANP